jgi:hypothetical protein
LKFDPGQGVAKRRHAALNRLDPSNNPHPSVSLSVDVETLDEEEDSNSLNKARSDKLTMLRFAMKRNRAFTAKSHEVDRSIRQCSHARDPHWSRLPSIFNSPTDRDYVDTLKKLDVEVTKQTDFGCALEG